MKIWMELLSDTVFGNGVSVPGGEDISVLHDADGFPYYKGSTLKGIFREELKRLLMWQGKPEKEADSKVEELAGVGGEDRMDDEKLVFSDMTISEAVKGRVLETIGRHPEDVLDAFTNLRTFTALDEDGVVKRGSLRVARCVNQGIFLEGELSCRDKDKELVRETLGLIKWIGSMRNRGFGKVRITWEEA